MTKPVVFDGVTYHVPEDASDDEVISFVESQHPASADTQPSSGGFLSKLAGAMSTAEQADVIPAADAGRAVAGFMPGTGVASALFGKQPAFDNPDSPWPTGIEDTPTLAQNIRQGNYGTAALQGAGMLPDVGYAATIAKKGAPVARELGQVAMNPRAAFTSRKPVAGAPLNEDEGAIAAALGDKPDRLVTQTPSAKIAEDKMYQQLLDSGWTPQKIEERLKWLGPQATLADLEPFSGLAKASSTTIKGQREAQRSLGSRQRGAENRLLGIIDDTLTDKNIYDSTDMLNKQRTASAAPKYKEAFSSDVPLQSARLDDMLKNPRVQQGINDGLKIIRDENSGMPDDLKIPMESKGIKFNAAGDPEYTGVPTLRVLDAAISGLDKQLEPFRDPLTKILQKTRESNAIIGLRDRLQKEIVSLSGGDSSAYGQARAAWAGPTRSKELQDMGYRILNNDPEINAKIVKNLSDEDKQFLQIGLARALKDKVRENPQAAVRLFNKGVTQDQIRAAFPDKRSFRNIHQQMLREAAYQKTANANLSGSRTAELVKGVKESESPQPTIPDDAVSMGMDVVSGKPVGALKKGASMLYRWAQKKPPPEVLNEIAPVAFSRDPVMQERMIQRFKARSMPTFERIPVDEDLAP